MTLTSFVLFPMLVVSVSVEDNKQNSPFELAAQCITALETGPVVLRVTLKYTGSTPILVSESIDHLVAVYGPTEWSVEQEVSYSNGPTPTVDRYLNPGDELTVIVPAHRCHANIKSGKCKLTLRRNMIPVDPQKLGEDRFLSLIPVETSIEVTIEKSSKQNLTRIYESLVSLLDQKRDPLRFQIVLAHLRYYSTHKEFMPLCFRLLDVEEVVNSHLFLAQIVYEGLPPPNNVDSLVQYLESVKPLGACSIFYFLRSRIKNELSSEILIKLQKAPNLWVRVLTYFADPELFDAKAKTALEDSLRSLNTPLKLVEISELLRQLDDKNYRIRAQARDQLVSYRESALVALQEALKQSNTPDVENWIQTILGKIKTARPDFLEEQVMNYLEESQRQARAKRTIFTAIAQGNSEAWITRRAKEILEREMKSDPPNNKKMDTEKLMPRVEVEPRTDPVQSRESETSVSESAESEQAADFDGSSTRSGNLWHLAYIIVTLSTLTLAGLVFWWRHRIFCTRSSTSSGGTSP